MPLHGSKALDDYNARKRKFEQGRGCIGLDIRHRKILPAALELSDPFAVVGCLLKSYYWGTTRFDRREFVKRMRAGTLYEYKPAVLNCVRSEYSRKRRELRVIFTLGTTSPGNLLQRSLWFSGAIVYIPNDAEWKRKRQEVDDILLDRQIKCLETLGRLGEVLPDAYIKGSDKRFTQAGVA